MHGVKALVMAAGKGSRLAPYTDFVPKPALPVGNEPIMGHVLNGLSDSGITTVHSSIGHLAEDMPKVFGNGNRWGVNLTFHEERTLLGTAGGVKALEGAMRSDKPFVVLSGDGLHSFDIRQLVQEHVDSGAIGSMALHQVDKPSQFGVVELGSHGKILGFQEKPAAGTERSNLVNTGIYIFSPEIFDHIPGGSVQDFGHQIFPQLLKDGEHLNGLKVEGYWNDVGTRASYWQSNLDVIAGRVGGVSPEGLGGAGGALRGVHTSADIHRGAQLVGTNVVGAGARVEDGAQLIDSVVLPGAHVHKNEVVANGIVGDMGRLREWADSGAP
jgi:mannose-1-phosphate guanylyltransferase/mannose-1-phosphate guanylyltransferase/phosphomannomutase